MDTLIEASLLGQEIKRIRLSLKITQKELSDDFVTVRAIQKIESGEITPSFEVLFHIANKLKIDMFDLILSSRIPFYIENQLDSLLAMLNRSQHFIKPNDVSQIKNVLTKFNKIKLPYNDNLKINIIYALFNTFFIEFRDDTREILKDHIQQFDLETYQPNDVDLLAVAGYISLESDDLKLKQLIEKLLLNQAFSYFPAVTYAINRWYERHGEYQLICDLAQAALNKIDIDQSIALVPYIYGQWAIAADKLNRTDAHDLANRGLALFKMLNKPEEFKLLKKWLSSEMIKELIEY